MRIRVNEIGATIQGETTYIGLPCVLVRLTGCPLRCVWCDTTYAYDQGQDWELPDLMKRLLAYDLPLVAVTGGEPLLQPATIPLMEGLITQGRTVLLETSGALDISAVPPQVHRIMDLKCPDSAMAHRNRYENVALLTPRDEVKMVIASRGDYEWARDQIRALRLLDLAGAVLFSPILGLVDGLALARWMVEDRLSVRLQIQLHKALAILSGRASPDALP